jgi:predicted outer membrane repeat protein
MKKPNKNIIRALVDLLAIAVIVIAAIAHCPPSLPVQASSAATTIYYAKPGGATSGSCDSWGNACDLQYALTTAAPDTEIWVQKGLYHPGLTTASTFRLRNGVELYGGFVGTEANRIERDWENNLTVLSGDLTGNDTVDANGIVFDANTPGVIVIPNAFHVVTGGLPANPIDETAVLDGFVVTAGYANDTLTSEGEIGGGFYNENGSPTIRHVSFWGNWVTNYGGGAYNGVNNTYTLVMTDVIFKNNHANVKGAGLNNEANNLRLDQVIFSGNQAINGGGIDIRGNGNVLITNSEFIGNSATSTIYYDRGGGLFMSQGGNGTLALTNVKFSGNYASLYGYGGGASLQSGGMATLTNVTFSGNYAGTQGGGLENYIPATTVVNSIFWANAAGSSDSQMYNPGGISVSYSDIQQSSGVFPGTGNVNADPLFVSPISAASAPTTTGDYHLQITSPAIDAGNNAAVTVTTDLDGYPRRMDVPSVPDTGSGTPPIVDMGAYETIGPPISNAGSDQRVGESALVTLDGSASSDPGGHLPLTFQWNQTGGPAVLLSSDTAVKPTFTSPTVSGETPLTFSLVVTNSVMESSPPDTVVITVEMQLCLPLIQKN